MELVANIWPVMDTATGLVIRFLARAYAMDAPDPVISSTLKALSATDFRMAKTYRIPEQFEVASEHGTLRGCVSIRDFHRFQGPILQAAFEDLEDSFARLQGLAGETASGASMGVAWQPRFPNDPYLVVTVLMESEDGGLTPQVSG